MKIGQWAPRTFLRNFLKIFEGGEAPLPTRATARLPKPAPVGRLTREKRSFAAKNVYGARIISAPQKG